MIHLGDTVMVKSNSPDGYIQDRFIKPTIVLGKSTAAVMPQLLLQVDKSSLVLSKYMERWQENGYRDVFIENIADYANKHALWYYERNFVKAQDINIILPNGTCHVIQSAIEIDSVFDLKDIGKVMVSEISEDKQTAWVDIIG